jgi:hypothetical protein
MDTRALAPPKETGRPAKERAALSKTCNPIIQLDRSSLQELERDRADRISRLRVRAARANWAFAPVHGPLGESFVACRWGRAIELPTLYAAERWFERIGVED